VIKSIVINNYQSHKKTILKFVEGVNVIVGKSQAGKTAILRALNWVLTNRPSGDRFVRHGQKKTSVTVRTTDGHKVTLIKNSKGRTYKVDGTTYRKFAKQIPEPVTEALQMSSINIQPQLEAPFLVTSSGGEISKTINKITQAEAADEWLKRINSEISSNRSEEKVLAADISDIKSRIASLSELPAITKKANEAKKLFKSIRKTIVKIEQLESTADGLESAQNELSMINHNITLIREKLAEFDNLADEIDGFNDQIEAAETYIELFEEKKELVQKISPLKSEYIRIIKRDGQCPTCFGDIDEDTISRIKESL
jgi:DNA repair exonuclease SbcCD ATPase subunit